MNRLDQIIAETAEEEDIHKLCAIIESFISNTAAQMEIPTTRFTLLLWDLTTLSLAAKDKMPSENEELVEWMKSVIAKNFSISSMTTLK